MSTNGGEKVQKLDPMDVITFLREHEQPVVTAGEVAEEFDVTPSAARYRLNQLGDQGRVRGKKVGASAKVWYLVTPE